MQIASRTHQLRIRLHTYAFQPLLLSSGLVDHKLSVCNLGIRTDLVPIITVCPGMGMLLEGLGLFLGARLIGMEGLTISRAGGLRSMALNQRRHH